MPAFRKLVALIAAHAALFGGCAVEVRQSAQMEPADAGGTADELPAMDAAEEEPSAEHPSCLYDLCHEGLDLGFVEQWLLFADLDTGEPIEAISLCEPAHDDGSDPACAETDRAGTVLTDWTPAEESYRILGTLPDGTEFVLLDVASTVLVNRLLRPIGVLARAELQAHYTSAGVTLETGRHTVLARARNGLPPAEGVRFTLQPVDCSGELTEHGCTTEAVADAGKADDAVQAIGTSLGHGLFLDVAPGLYALRGERDGVACSQAEVWLDGETAQVLAPELDCE